MKDEVGEQRFHAEPQRVQRAAEYRGRDAEPQSQQRAAEYSTEKPSPLSPPRLRALAAHRYNPIIANLKQRLAQDGKHKMTIVIAAMRKLLHLAYGVLKTGKPFDPAHATSHAAP